MCTDRMDHNAMQLNEKHYSDFLSARHTLAPHRATQILNIHMVDVNAESSQPSFRTPLGV